MPMPQTIWTRCSCKAHLTKRLAVRSDDFPAIVTVCSGCDQERGRVLTDDLYYRAERAAKFARDEVWQAAWQT